MHTHPKRTLTESIEKAMEKRIKSYLARVDALLASIKSKEAAPDMEETIQEHLTQKGFFAHERLIHLIVTVLFAILEMLALFMALVTGNIAAVVLAVAVLVLLVPYVRHYYILENGVQRMYSQYDELIKLKSAQQNGGW